MGKTTPWETSLSASRQTETLSPCEGGEAGLLEKSRGFLLGTKSAAWLKKNEDRAFEAADSALSQVIETQSLVQALLDDAKAGILPQVATADGPQDMTPLAFAERLVDLNVSVLTGLEKVISVRNKVATGGTNILTAALMGSNAMQFAAARKERVAGVKRRVGVDAIPEGVIDV